MNSTYRGCTIEFVQSGAAYWDASIYDDDKDEDWGFIGVEMLYSEALAEAIARIDYARDVAPEV